MFLVTTNKSKRLLQLSFVEQVNEEDRECNGKDIGALLADGCGLFIKIDGSIKRIGKIL
jgi:hypothetical protein